MQPGRELEHFTDWAGKAPGAAARLAGVLHGVKHAHGRPWDVVITAETMNAAEQTASRLLRNAKVQSEIARIKKEKEEKLVVNANWVLLEQKNVYDAAIRAGDLSNANRALENIGKHRDVNAFKTEDESGKSIDTRWIVEFVYTCREDYDRREKCIEHNPR